MCFVFVCLFFLNKKATRDGRGAVEANAVERDFTNKVGSVVSCCAGPGDEPSTESVDGLGVDDV